jgi:DoxX-like family
MLRATYWLVTGLLALLMLFASANYVFKHELIVEVFTRLGYPTYLIYPLAIAKLLGVAAILIKKSRTLKEWAYAGFFFDFLLALAAHLRVGDGQFVPALGCLILLLISYGLDRKLYP